MRRYVHLFHSFALYFGAFFNLGVNASATLVSLQPWIVIMADLVLLCGFAATFTFTFTYLRREMSMSHYLPTCASAVVQAPFLIISSRFLGTHIRCLKLYVVTTAVSYSTQLVPILTISDRKNYIIILWNVLSSPAVYLCDGV